MIYVIATIELVEGKRADYLMEFKKVRSHVCNEQGCIQYGAAIDLATDIPIQDPINENIVTIIESWADVAALKAHTTASHMLDYRNAVKDYVKKITIKILEPV
ncbi:MAG: putative quinol monooxygenase YgiN [Syntrophus sp. SKADARSKE-3]|nr:putative quinol monooxygenase YgiN [Syntrophus sp. SKADARSKE-3]